MSELPMSEVKLAIGIPNMGTLKAQTVSSLVAMIRALPCPNWLLLKEGSILHANREHLVQKAIDLGATHLLFVDSDMMFEPDAAFQLLNRHKDIVGVHYNRRVLPATTTVHMDAEKKKNIATECPEGFTTCDSVGTGFMLIDLKVFDKLKHPWFFWEAEDTGEVKTGEDYWFCQHAREAGFEVWVDLTIKMGHIGDYIY